MSLRVKHQNLECIVVICNCEKASKFLWYTLTEQHQYIQHSPPWISVVEWFVLLRLTKHEKCSSFLVASRKEIFERRACTYETNNISAVLSQYTAPYGIVFVLPKTLKIFNLFLDFIFIGKFDFFKWNTKVAQSSWKLLMSKGTNNVIPCFSETQWIFHLTIKTRYQARCFGDLFWWNVKFFFKMLL